MQSRLAVVGTDTGVGKTVVTAGLTAWLRREGIDARAVKPVQTGHLPPAVDDPQLPSRPPVIESTARDAHRTRDAPLAGDAAVVASVCGDREAAVCLRYLEPPLAPRVAAAVERERDDERTEDDDTRLSIDIEYDALLAACDRTLAASEIGIVEGIGGLRVPLTADREVIDLVADLACPAVLVSRSGLGTLNHTALSVAALERRDVHVLAIVCNEYHGETVAERTNPAELERMTGIPVETVPPLDVDDPDAIEDEIESALAPYVGTMADGEPDE